VTPCVLRRAAVVCCVGSWSALFVHFVASTNTAPSFVSGLAIGPTTGPEGDQGKPGKPGHRSIGRGSWVRPGGWCRTPVNSSGTRLTLALSKGPVIAPYPFPSASSVGVGRHRGSTWLRQSGPP
jgi:hypothetical protein